MSSSVKVFEARLYKFVKDQPMMFCYKEELPLYHQDRDIEEQTSCVHNTPMTLLVKIRLVIRVVNDDTTN